MRHWIVIATAGALLAAAAYADLGVLAFVPQMEPLTRVEPVYPEAARAQHISGLVRLLATIDPQGLVVDVEVLTGPSVLRQAAIVAVKKWTFQPVLRGGRSVAAITDQLVSFIISGEPTQRDPAAEMIASAQRLAQLNSQFPRDAAQVLADTEQQAAGATGEHRFYALTGLAKAALAAGNEEKAGNYATEMLAIAVQYPKDWNYGNAVHFGNMILGRIALHHGDVTSARRYLLESGRTPGSPQLGSFGPNVTLAKELIEVNERATALEYFALCRSFWKMGGQKLDDWSKIVRAGGMPDFGANLLF
jgi:TonB family protein